jgi:hypothetical protein
MNLKDYLSNKGKAPKGKTKTWMRFCTLDVATGALWGGDPHVANADDGCVVKVPPGRYAVEAIGLACGRRDRVVARLRVRLASVKNPVLGKEIGETGTDSAMIGVCDIKAFDAACKPDSGDEVQEAIEAQTDDGFGIITFKKFPGAVMPFIPTGSDGSGPVFALMSGARRIGMELSFMDDNEPPGDKNPPQQSQTVTLLGKDQPDFITRLVDSNEVSFWVGGGLKAGVKFALWSSASRGPVDYRVRRASGSVAKTWSAMKRITGGGATFRAFETLKEGKYEIDFRIGKQVCSPLKLTFPRH